MAITLISANLNLNGNAGNFETDQSTWGFTPSDTNLSRSSTFKTKGLYSAKAVNLNPGGGPSDYQIRPLEAKAYIEHGKTYIAYAKVLTPSSNPIAIDTWKAAIEYNGFKLILTESVPALIPAIKDTFVQVSVKFTLEPSSTPDFVTIFLAISGPTTSGMNYLGVVYVDEFEIYEYSDVYVPPPVCTLEIDNDGTTVVDETSDGAGDGSITMAVTGATGTIEYSKDGGTTWQTSALFAGLTTGIYIIKAREQSLISCVKEYPFAVNNASADFDFTVAVTDEDIAGLHDGVISITPTGTGAPFQYTIDGGITWVSGNNFTNLTPGLYYVAVRDVDGNAIVKLVTVAAGTVQFDKIFHSKNPITLQKAAAAGWEVLVNYRLYNDVQVEDVADSGNYVSKLKTELPPDTAGNVVFYSRQAFRGVFSFTVPLFNAAAIIRLTDRIKRFKNNTGQLTGVQTTPGSVTPSVANLVIWGGIDKVHFPDLNFFTTYLPANKKFLTWAPVEKYVDRQQEDYLNFWCYGNFNTLKLQAKVYFDDDTNETAVVTTISGTKYTELYQLPAGPANCGALLVNPLKTAVKYELSLLDQTDSLISEVRTYYINAIRHPLTRVFMFLNALGAFETLLFTGQASEDTDITGDLIQKVLPYNYKALDGEFETNHNIITRKQNFSSGFIRNRLAKQWHEYMIDFLASSRVYDVTTGARIPIVITASSHKTEDQNYEYFIRFDARTAYDNDSFTPSEI